MVPADTAPGIQAVEVRIPHRVDPTFADPEFLYQNDGYYIEARSPASKWGSGLAQSDVVANTEGVIITFNDGFSSWLLDMSPSPYLTYDWGSTADLRDVVLHPGMTFETPDVRITCTEKTASGTFLVDVEVQDNW